MAFFLQKERNVLDNCSFLSFQSVLEAVQRRFGGCPKMNEVLRTIIDLIEDSELKSGYADSDQGCDFQIVNAESVSINVTSINQSLK